jgi:hypothetical protein
MNDIDIEQILKLNPFDTQQQLARLVFPEANKPEAVWQHFKNSKNIRPQNLLRLANILGVTVELLFGSYVKLETRTVVSTDGWYGTLDSLGVLRVFDRSTEISKTFLTTGCVDMNLISAEISNRLKMSEPLKIGRSGKYTTINGKVV